MKPDTRFAWEITPDEKAEFLAHIRDGLNRQDAAEKLGYTGTIFRRLVSPAAEHYDHDFAQAYKAALNSDEHDAGQLEEIRDMQFKAARKGEWRAIEKLSLVYDPAWKELRHQNLNVNVEMIARMMPGFTLEQIEQAYEDYQAMRAQNEPKLLPPAAEADAA